MPYGTHPDLPDFDYRRQLEECAEQLAALGAKANALGLRLSTHPGQYTVLNALDETLRRKSSSRSGAGRSAARRARAGHRTAWSCSTSAASTATAPAALDRWARGLRGARRSAPVRGSSSSTTSAPSTSRTCSSCIAAPACASSTTTTTIAATPPPALADPAEALAAACATWPGRRAPKVHLSSPRTELRSVGKGKAAKLVPPLVDQHADFVTPWDLADVLARWRRGRST